MLRVTLWLLSVCVLVCVLGSGCKGKDDLERSSSDEGGLQIDPATGIPYALTFQFPVMGFDTSDFGFGFASENSRFCLQYSGSQCVSYGYHLGRDTVVGETPFGTEIVAPGDGIVRVTTDLTFGGYGSDTSSNPQYQGCVIVLEHEFQSGQRVTTLLGHVQRESGTTYDPSAKTGNPPVGALVRRGQYLAHVAHYWAGAGQTTDWHHSHWAMRKGSFSIGSYSHDQVVPYVRGYAKKSEFTIDSVTGAWTHPLWIDPFVVVAANSDPALSASADVRHHPSGTLLENQNGNYSLVLNEKEIAGVPNAVLAADRFDLSGAVRVTDVEIGCYATAVPLASQGHVTLYQRPNSSTVVMAYDDAHIRYDVIRWEALLSWGYDDSDLTTDMGAIGYIETAYVPKGFRLLRPGTLVKGDEQTEVAIVTAQQTRLPIASGEVFEALGFGWERVVTIPQSVLTAVAGPRENAVIDLEGIHACAVPLPCPNGGNCGGGGDPERGSPETCNGFDDDGDGQIDEIFLCKLGDVGNACITACNTAGFLMCTSPACNWGECRPYSEDCVNTIDDDCNGLTDCDDPACSADPVCDNGSSSSSGGGSSFTQLHLAYTGPQAPGLIHLEGWWQPPNDATRNWAPVSDCTDATSGDGALDCTFSLPSDSSPFEFQVYLPDGRYWGDRSCSPQGGCGSTVGSLTLTGPNGPIAVSLVPNNPNNLPYFNGHVDQIP